VLIQPFVAEIAIEALQLPVLHGLAEIDDIELHPMAISPGVEGPSSEI